MQALTLVWVAPARDTSCTPARPNDRKEADLYTPQHLFGEVGPSSDILTHEPFLERARLQRELEQDGPARLALGAYVVARLIGKLLTIAHGEDQIEGFQWQLEAVRRHINELPANSPETAHLTGVVAAVPGDGPLTASLWKSLTAYAYFLEHDGRLEESLEILTLAFRTQAPSLAPADFVPYALMAGRLNRLLTRWDVATSCYQAAQETACSIGDLNRALRARLGRAHVFRSCGNLPRARTEIEQVLAEATGAALDDVLSDAHQDLGNILMLQGDRANALNMTYKGFRLCPDPVNRMKILGDLGYALNESGHFDAARVALEIVAASDASYHVRINALLELMQLESAIGNRVAFERRRGQARALVERMAPSTRIDYGYKTAVGLARFGQITRAREIGQETLSIAERHGLHEWYFRIERMLRNLEVAPNQNREIEPPAQAKATDAVLQMTSGLREYASMSAF
jgi:tetratricopeptide (TPR) repeat protein